MLRRAGPVRTILWTIGLLVVSNTFMTIAWYGHLKHNHRPLVVAIVLSWGIAFFEYVFQVPANRIGSARLSLTQLKILQECIALSVFVVYAWVAYREPARWNTMAAMLLVVAAVALTFVGGSPGGRP